MWFVRPFIVIFWALYDLGLLAGSNQFVQHWGYWQDVVRMFNESNPSGNVTSNETYLLILQLAIAMGVSVALKRFVVGLLLGRQTFGKNRRATALWSVFYRFANTHGFFLAVPLHLIFWLIVHYGEELAKVMKRMVLVSEVASLARLPLPRKASEYIDERESMRASEWRNHKAFTADELSTTSNEQVQHAALDMPILEELDRGLNKAESNGTQTTAENAAARSQAFSAGAQSAGVTGAYSEPDKELIIDLLERWEEPDRVNTHDSKATLSAVLQFRRALTVLRRRYPFSAAFGPSDTREICIESAQDVFDRLLLRDADSEDDFLNFDVLAVLAADASTGELDEYKLKQLIKIFRPNRDGRLSRLAFVKSVDAVYKRMRFLGANIHNSSQIDIATESLLNVGFYFILVCIVLGALGIDPLRLFFSLSSFVLAFAFMFGTAAANYFSGVLLILVQRPFGKHCSY